MSKEIIKLEYLEVLSLILVSAKVFGFIDWSWYMVFAPVLIPIIIVLGIIILIGFLYVLAFIIEQISKFLEEFRR